MPQRLAGVSILLLVLLIPLGLFLPFSIAHAEVPVMNGKVLLYWSSNESPVPGYTSIIYMYNDTSIAIVSASYSSHYIGPYIVSYDPSANKLVFHGTLMYVFKGTLHCSEPSDRSVMLLLLLTGFAGQYVLPKSLIENLNQIAGTGYVNFVQTYTKWDNGYKQISESCIVPFNSTALSISTEMYMGYPAVVITLNLDIPGWQHIKAYWRTDGVLLAIINGTQSLVKLVAEDDLGLKKTGENQQPTGGAGSSEGSATSTTTSSYPGSETSTSTLTTTQGSPSPTQTVGNTGQVTTPKPESPETASSISTPGKPSAGLPSMTVAIIALIVIVVALAIIVKRK